MSGRRQRRRKEPEAGAGKTGPRVLALFFAGAMLVIALVLGLKEGSPEPASRAQAPRAPAPVFGANTMEVASKFLCACGACDVPELADCTCPTAVEEKRFIEQELGRGTSEAQVVRAVYERYGRIKPRFAGLGNGEEAGTPATEPSGASKGRPAETAGSAAPAQPTDAARIASRFICACGECTDHVLSECDCEHPRGAAEMKAFIDYKISQKKHGTEEIVDQVAYEYGHLRER